MNTSFRRGVGRTELSAALLLALSSPCCTQSSATPLLIVNWWTESSEQSAFTQLKSKHQETHPTVTVSTGNAMGVPRQQVGQQLMNRAAPDSFQANIGVGLLRWSKLRRDGADDLPLEDVNGIMEPAELHDDLRAPLTRDNHVYGVPIDIHRTNLIYYNAQKTLTTLEPPSNLSAGYFTLERFCTADELSEVQKPVTRYATKGTCVDEANGAVPTMALLAASWGIQNFVLEQLLPAIAGARFYRDFVAGEGDDIALGEPPTLTQATRETLTKVLRCTRAVRNHVRICKSTSWVGTVNAVSDGRADFTVGGDWIRGELVRSGTLGTKVRVAAFPTYPNDGSVFVYTSDVFPLPRYMRHQAQVTEFLHTVFDPELQTAFSSVKGSVPAVTSVRKATADSTDELTAFDDADHRLLATSGLLPPKYPPELAWVLEALLLTDDQPEINLEKALVWLEIGFAEVKAWRRSLNLP